MIRFILVLLALVSVAIMASTQAYADGPDTYDTPPTYEDDPEKSWTESPYVYSPRLLTQERPAWGPFSEEPEELGPFGRTTELPESEPEAGSGTYPDSSSGLATEEPAAVEGFPEGTALVTAQVPLYINGIEVQSFPAMVDLGSDVCVAQPVQYMTEAERLVFRQWSNGATDHCITLNRPGEYRAVMAYEVLLLIDSEARAFRASKWVTRGATVPLVVPQAFEDQPGIRYTFEKWSDGERPYSASNTISPVRAMTISVRWNKEVYIKLLGPEGAVLRGSGWHPQGKSIIIQADPEVNSPDGWERSKFVQWQSTSEEGVLIPSMGNPLTTLTADAPHTIEAVYRTEYLVVAENPTGTIKRVWVAGGEEVSIETPETIDIVPNQIRYAFKGWDGASLGSQKGFLVVDGPVHLRAVYEKQYMLQVASPYGSSGEGWYPEGQYATVRVPENPRGIIFFKKEFEQFAGYGTQEPVLQAQVNGPLTITADYRTKVNVLLLTTLVVGVTAILGIYMVAQMKLKHDRPSRRRDYRARLRRRVPTS